MKKKWLALALSAAMVTGLAACGGSSAPAPAAEPAGTDSTVATAEPAGDEGSVLNVQVWNEEFINRVADHYPGYEKIESQRPRTTHIRITWMHCFRATRTQQLMTR